MNINKKIELFYLFYFYLRFLLKLDWLGNCFYCNINILIPYYVKKFQIYKRMKYFYKVFKLGLFYSVSRIK